MNAIGINRPLAHPWRWILAAFLAVTLISILLIGGQLYSAGWRLGNRAPEAYIWTCDADYQHFYGPGTPQSLAVVNRILELKKTGLTEFKMPAKPILITPAFFGKSGSADEPVFIAGFDLRMAEALRESHAREKHH